MRKSKSLRREKVKIYFMCLKLASFHAARLILRLIIVYQAYLIVLTHKKTNKHGFCASKNAHWSPKCTEFIGNDNF